MVLCHIGSILRHLVRDNPFREAIGSRSLSQQLCVAGIIQAGVEERCLVDRTAHSKETVSLVHV